MHLTRAASAASSLIPLPLLLPLPIQVKRLTGGALEVPVVASVVVSGSYEDDADGIDELVYTGGGRARGGGDLGHWDRGLPCTLHCTARRSARGAPP